MQTIFGYIIITAGWLGVCLVYPLAFPIGLILIGCVIAGN